MTASTTHKPRLSIEFDDRSLYRALKIAAAEGDTTMRQIVFRALREYLARLEYQRDHTAPVRPAVTLSEAAARLRDLPSPGDGFADDLEAVQVGQPDAGAPSWLP